MLIFGNTHALSDENYSWTDGMTTINQLNSSDVDLLIVRLLKAASRVERHLYAREVTAREIRFHLDWADALLSLAERLNRLQEARWGSQTDDRDDEEVGDEGDR